MTWDRGNPNSQRPPWSPEAVLEALKGVPRTRSTRLVKSPYDGVHYTYVDLVFDCGCCVKGDEGWSPCGRNFVHVPLAHSTPNSVFAQDLFRKRPVFDAVLAAAWYHNGPKDPQYLADFQAYYKTGIEEWRANHDLAEDEIWTNLGLSADLTPMPLECRLELYNGGNAAAPKLRMELSKGDVSMNLTGFPIQGVINLAFG
jgi:hypothetical protein